MQHLSSETHKALIRSGLVVTSTKSWGTGDAEQTLVRYSDGNTWLYDNGSAVYMPGEVWGWPEANAAQEEAWFLTRERAQEFAAGCGIGLGEPEFRFISNVNLEDIIP